MTTYGQVPMALKGNSVNIAVGDLIGTGAVAGYGYKSLIPTKCVGYAMAAATADSVLGTTAGYVNVFVDTTVILQSTNASSVGTLLADTTGLSSFWSTCTTFDDPAAGTAVFENFRSGVPASGVPWTVTQNTNGTFALSTVANNIAILDTGAATEYKGPNVQRTGWPLIIPTASNTIWFETYLSETAVANGDLWIGLSATSTGLLSASSSHALGTAVDQVGFTSVTGDGALLCTNSRSTSREVTAATGTGNVTALTMVDATSIKLGFKMTASAITWYVNGVAMTRAVTAAKIPNTGPLLASLAIHNTAAATEAYLNVKWIAFACTR